MLQFIGAEQPKDVGKLLTRSLVLKVPSLVSIATPPSICKIFWHCFLFLSWLAGGRGSFTFCRLSSGTFEACQLGLYTPRQKPCMGPTPTVANHMKQSNWEVEINPCYLEDFGGLEWGGVICKGAGR